MLQRTIENFETQHALLIDDMIIYNDGEDLNKTPSFWGEEIGWSNYFYFT